MADVKCPEACEALESQMIWICRQKGRVKSEGRLPSTPKPKPWRRSAPLSSSPLFSSGCSETANNNFLFLQRTNSIVRVHFFHLHANKVVRLRQGVPVCLPIGQEAVTGLIGGDYAGMRTFHTATHRDKLRLLTFSGL